MIWSYSYPLCGRQETRGDVLQILGEAQCRASSDEGWLGSVEHQWESESHVGHQWTHKRLAFLNPAVATYSFRFYPYSHINVIFVQIHICHRTCHISTSPSPFEITILPSMAPRWATTFPTGSEGRLPRRRSVSPIVACDCRASRPPSWWRSARRSGRRRLDGQRNNLYLDMIFGRKSWDL